MLRRNIGTIPIIFIIATITSTIGLVYAFSSYFGVYAAVRNFNVSIAEFSVVELNATHVYIETILTLSNPEPQEFRIFYFEQRISLNSQFFTFTRPPEPSEYRPMRMQAQSIADVAIDTDVPPNRLEQYREASEKTWFTSVLVVVDGPIIGRFRLTVSREITTS